MRHLRRLLVVGLAVAVCLLFGVTTASAHPATSFNNMTCRGGAVAPGNYGALTIAGSCFIPSGTVTVHQHLSIGTHGALDAATQAPTLIVYGNVSIASHGTFVLGCSAAFSPPCPSGVTTHDVIFGSVIAFGALALLFHSSVIHGNLTEIGGGGGTNCNPHQVLQGSPAYSTFEDMWIGGKVVIQNYHSCWFGLIRSQVHGTVLIRDNTYADPDANEVVNNTIFGNLSCADNAPAPQIGDSGGGPNTVMGKMTGQCADID